MVGPASLPSGTIGSAYSSSLLVSGGTAPYTWSFVSGNLPAGISLNTSTGLISGTPTASWNGKLYGFGCGLGESCADEVGHACRSRIAPVGLAITTSSLPSGTVNSQYSTVLQANGGTSPYAWSISAGSLPAGLSLAASTGIISGTPTAAGTSNLTATVTDSESPAQTKSVSLSIVIAPATLTITSSALVAGTQNSTYTGTLQATGGTGAYTWSISSGSLPAGLSLAASTGIVSGKPTGSGNFSFGVTVKDSGSPAQSASGTVTISVAAAGAALSITTTTLPGGVPNQTYSTTLSADGGTSPYTWSLTTGTLPAGLSLAASTGVISGKPTASGTSSLTFSVSDSSSPVQTKTVSLSLVVAPVALTITTTSLPGGTSGSSYSNLLAASGGTTPYTWSISAGSLPAGLALGSSTGLISGTPTATGTSSFTVKVTDSSSPALTKTLKLSIVVAAPAPTPLTISTTSLSAGTKGSTYSTAMQAGGGTTPYAWSITSGSLPAGLSLASAASGVISGTPTASGTTSFTATVTDSGSPAQTQSVQLSIVVAAAAPPALTISATLPSGAVSTAYSNPMTASGGTPPYTWSITGWFAARGTNALRLPPASSRELPTTSGTSNFTATVTDNGSPAQTQSAATSIVVAAAQAPPGPGNTWFVRADGGTRYSVNVPQGQCDGLADVAYPGTGTNQHCAFNDFRYLWDDDSGQVGIGAWVIAGGDTVVVRGCSALPNQMNAANPTCRIGWDINSGGGSTNAWCWGVGNATCYNPPIPAGTATQHTRILGGCAYGAYNCTPINSNYPYGTTNETQLFGGMGLLWTFNLGSTQYVDIQGIELTTHNGVCTFGGAPSYPRSCNNSEPLDDYAQNGFIFNNTSSNISLQDVYVHGFNASGFYGPIGGPIALTRVFSGFGGFSGWNFQDQSDTANATGSSITASYVTMIGNGCYEQYPIKNPAYPAQACYDDVAGGFGDAWSGQDTNLDSFTCDHCVQMYNTKDGFIGPHAAVATLTITNSTSLGNMGQQWKWGGQQNSTVLFQDNVTVGNCTRMSQPLPGAAQNFALSTGLGGSYLSDFCRAAGNMIDTLTQVGSRTTSTAIRL